MFLLHIFVTIILPVIVVLTLGYMYARRFSPDVRQFTRLVWNITGPCLAFAGLASSSIPNDDFVRIFVFVAITTLALWPITEVAARLLHLDRPTTSSFQLSVLFGNIVNYGFPVLLFAWGAGAVERGVVYMTGNQAFLGTLAVYLASRGSSSWRKSLGNIAKVPLLYASLLGFIVNRLAIVIPKPIFDPINLVGQSNLMIMLLILGMQLAQVKLTDGRKAIAVAVALRLGLSVVLGAVVAAMLGMQGLTRQVAILEAGTPAAVYASVIATEYGCNPDFAAATIFVSTIASMVTMTIVLALLGVR
jgi:malate permease and related proteins